MKKTIRERISRMIEKEKSRLNAEISVFEKHLRDVESYYGCGGPYNRVEKAIHRRYDDLEDLEDFEEQLNHIKKHIPVSMYVFGCQNCQTVFMTVKRPFDNWHECPTCRHMVMIKNPQCQTISIVENGQPWSRFIENALKGE